MISQNFSDSSLAVLGASVIDREDGFILVKSSSMESHAHLSAIAYDSEEVGIELWRHAVGALSDSGFKSLQFGGDIRHFFPGCPIDFAELSGFLDRRGMKPAETLQHDLERDLADYLPPTTPSEEARVCLLSDCEKLEEFFMREFPGRWRDDTMGVFRENPERVIGLFIEGVCEGFAMTQMEGDRLRLAGATWSADLGADWGALGPIGVSKAVRGQGYGGGLLAAALCVLRDKGARQTIIDWTTLVDFYGKHGFKVSRSYRSYRTDITSR